LRENIHIVINYAGLNDFSFSNLIQSIEPELYGFAIFIECCYLTPVGDPLSGGFAFRRRGEIRLNTDEESRGKPTSFLQGVVEKRRIYSLGLSY
jgi:hypothetical protein